MTAPAEPTGDDGLIQRVVEDLCHIYVEKRWLACIVSLCERAYVHVLGLHLETP